MKYITTVLQFLEKYDVIVLSVAAALLTLFAVVNFSVNVYRKQNKKITAVTNKIASFPNKTAQFTSALPSEYKRQWRAYVNSGAAKPSLTFEFAPIKNRVRLLRLFILTAVISSLYIAAFAFDTARREYIIFQIVFWLAFALIMIVRKILSVRKERKAKRIFARFVTELNRATALPQSAAEQLDKTVAELKEINKRDVTDAALSRASELLHSKGLSANRSVEQQRKLNGALNGLLQSYARATVK